MYNYKTLKESEFKKLLDEVAEVLYADLSQQNSTTYFKDKVGKK